MSLPDTKYKDNTQVAAFIDRTLENVQAIPGVRNAGSTTPLFGGWQTAFRVEGRPEPAPGQMPSTDINRVSPDYFRAIGVQLLKGRFFTDQDQADSLPVCIVDETFAQTYWPNEDPVGKRVALGSSRDPRSKWMEIVGMVAHVKNYGVDEPSRVELYLPYRQSPLRSFTLVIRSSVDAASLTSSVRQAVLKADPDVPVYGVQTMGQIIDENTAERRMAVMLVGTFGGVALLLAIVGIYGVISSGVSQRTQEIGIRMALGAQQGNILRMVMMQGALVTTTGVIIGLSASLVVARMIRSLLFETSANDVSTLLIVPVGLAAIALLACYMPARRATRVDPLEALRYE